MYCLQVCQLSGVSETETFKKKFFPRSICNSLGRIFQFKFLVDNDRKNVGKIFFRNPNSELLLNLMNVSLQKYCLKKFFNEIAVVSN